MLKDKEENWDYKTDLFKDMEGTKTELFTLSFI